MANFISDGDSEGVWIFNVDTKQKKITIMIKYLLIRGFEYYSRKKGGKMSFFNFHQSKLLSIALFITLGFTISNAETVRIMPLGDSITYDENVEDLEEPRPIGIRTGYRSHLWYQLKAAAYEADFVGSKVAGEKVTPKFDPDNEGHPGWSSYKLEEYTYKYLANNPADIVLLHIGTNDHRTSTAGVEQILDWIDLYEKESGHQVKVIVAMIIDRQEPDPIIEIFNENLKETVGRRVKNGDLLTLVDMYKGAGLKSLDYADNTHPNNDGYRKMAKVWEKALLSPYTPGLHAFPYTLVDQLYIDAESIIVNTAASTVEFITEIPDDGITF